MIGNLAIWQTDQSELFEMFNWNKTEKETIMSDLQYVELYHAIMVQYYTAKTEFGADYWWNHRTKFIMLCRENSQIY